jgi:hypothetical protein
MGRRLKEKGRGALILTPSPGHFIVHSWKKTPLDRMGIKYRTCANIECGFLGGETMADIARLRAK